MLHPIFILGIVKRVRQNWCWLTQWRRRQRSYTFLSVFAPPHGDTGIQIRRSHVPILLFGITPWTLKGHSPADPPFLSFLSLA